MNTLIDTNQLKYNEQAMREIENESRMDADAAYRQADIADGSKRAYYTGYYARLVRIVRKHTAKIERAIEYDNGLIKWVYLDSDGQIVAETIGDAPLFDTSSAAAVLGSHTSERKAAAVRENGRKGGRPRKNPVTPPEN